MCCTWVYWSYDLQYICPCAIKDRVALCITSFSQTTLVAGCASFCLLQLEYQVSPSFTWRNHDHTTRFLVTSQLGQMHSQWFRALRKWNKAQGMAKGTTNKFVDGHPWFCYVKAFLDTHSYWSSIHTLFHQSTYGYLLRTRSKKSLWHG